MKATPSSNEKEINQPGDTACSAGVPKNLQIPSIYYKGDIIHFFGQEYRQIFTEDPLNSSLASRLLSGE